MRLVLLRAALLFLTGCGPLDDYCGRNMGFHHAGGDTGPHSSFGIRFAE
ncbi:hypothetical protein SAMN05519105_3716 [Rhodobacter sp. 24-YEA-8]|nr:hypothetical protein SAMN05519105_3716 [Rhodobacter sp. 24-YEA-8]